jgi:glycosyltransferase involved in cell wall biosynthesis
MSLLESHSRFVKPRQHSRRMLVVAHGYPPLQSHGGELHIQRKVNWWHALGHDVRVITADPQVAGGITFDQIEESNDLVDGIPVLRLKVAAPDATQPLSHTFNHPLLRSTLDREIRSYQPDLIYQISGYIFGVIPLQLAHQYRIPSFLFAVDYWHVCQRFTLLRPDQTCCTGARTAADCAACRLTSRHLPQRLGRRKLHWLWQATAAAGNLTRWQTRTDVFGVGDFETRESTIHQTLRNVSLVIVNSKFLGDWMRQAGIPDDRILTIRQGINPLEFANRTVDSRIENRGDDLNVLYLGQVTHHKGVDTLVEAVGRLIDAGHRINLSVYGPMTDGTRFLRRLKRFVDHPRVSVGSPISRRQIVEALGEASVLVVPSRWYDNSPNVVLEAFSTGVPVIAANHGGTAEMVRHGIDGLLFEPGDVHSLENTLRRLLNEPDLLPRLRDGISRPHDVDVEMWAEEVEIERLLSVG